MKKDHIRLIPIIDAGICAREGYEPYESGLARDAFCRKENGELFQAAVWPGVCCFPDFLNAEARAWFGELYRPLLEEGIEPITFMSYPKDSEYLLHLRRRVNEAIKAKVQA